MIRFKNLVVAGTFGAIASMAFASPASAQVARTWVSGIGDDINPCSRTAPCKTFAGAIAKTNAGGEINCLDAAGYGAVTITKSVTITCDGVEAGVVVSGTPAVTISAGVADMVTLSGLDLLGSVSGPNGILINSAGVVVVRNTKIESFTATGASGIAYRGSGLTRLTLDNVTLLNNYYGLSVQPTAGGGGGFIAVTNSTVSGNSSAGVRFAINNGGSVRATIDGSSLVANGDGVIADTTANAGSVGVAITDSTLSLNLSGITSVGANSSVIVGGSTITGNNVGVLAASSAVLKSFGGNRFEVNATDGTFTGNVATK